jgi:hypothetical protein
VPVVEPEADVEVGALDVGLFVPVSELGVVVEEPLAEGVCDEEAGGELASVAVDEVWPLGGALEDC